jgi:GT2 family glycosyltransferase
MTSSLAVVIVNWRREELTLRCVSMVRNWSTLKPRLVVIDNQSNEQSQRTLSKSLHLNELLRSQRNLGYAGGNNLGIRHALQGSPAFVLLLNNDAQVTEGSICQLLKRFEQNPDVAILGPVLNESHCGIVRIQIGGKDLLRNSLTRHTIAPNEIPSLPGYPLIDVEYVPGSVFLARAGLFEKVGSLDERFFFSGEIADLCKRTRESGDRVCIDLEVEALHDSDETPSSLRDTLYVYYSLRNRLLYATKHYPSRPIKNFVRWLKLCSSELGKAIVQARLSKARAIALAILHACANRYGNQNDAFF